MIITVINYQYCLASWINMKNANFLLCVIFLRRPANVLSLDNMFCHNDS